MKKYNLIVVGGGLTGVAAAVSGAREGLSVLLVEKSGCLGGAISNNLVYPFTKYWMRESAKAEIQYINSGIFKEMRKREYEYRHEVGEPDEKPEYLFKPEYYKFILDDMITEAGVDVLFHSVLSRVRADGRQVRGITVCTVSGELELESDFFIDATGDGLLIALSGCDCQVGRETDGLCQPMTTCFRVSGVDVEVFLEDIDRLQKLYKEKQAFGEIKNPRENLLYFHGVGKDIIHFNTTRIIKLDPTNPFDVSRAEIEGRCQVYETFRFLKENSEAFRDSTIVSIANEVGVRESRKLKGVHVLTQNELKEMVDFEDSIAVGNYDIDIHNPSGSGTSHYYFGFGEYYKIPYRCLLPKEYDNLLVGGRCISVTHEAQASIRVMAICACTGQAAGTAAAVAFNSGKNVHNADVKQIQKVLTDNGAVIR